MRRASGAGRQSRPWGGRGRGFPPPAAGGGGGMGRLPQKKLKICML